MQKWSRSDRAFKKRLLALTKSSVVEMDIATRFGHTRKNASRNLKTHSNLVFNFCFYCFLPQESHERISG